MKKKYKGVLLVISLSVITLIISYAFSDSGMNRDQEITDIIDTDITIYSTKEIMAVGLSEKSISYSYRIPDVDIYLPTEVAVAVGTTIELYNNQVIRTQDYSLINIDWEGTIGKQYDRKVTITGETVGDYVITCKIYDGKGHKITQASTTVKVVRKSYMENPFRMLCIGASYTSNKPWYVEWKKLLGKMTGNEENIDFIGTLPLTVTSGFHEGRPGATMNTYTTASGSKYFGDIIIKVSGIVSIPTTKKRYKFLKLNSDTTYINFEVEESYIDKNGDGTIKLNRQSNGYIEESGSVMEVDSEVDGDNYLFYSYVEYPNANPFWNPQTNGVDFNYYLIENSLDKPDGVQLFIGTNSLSGGIASIDESNQKILEFIGYIRRDWGSSVKIYVCLIPYFSNQNGVGISYGLGMPKYLLDNYVFYQTSKVGALIEALKDTNVFITPISITHDSQYNFGEVEVNVNPRNLNYKEYYPKEAVHPQIEGYYQFADCMFSTWIRSL